MEGFRTCAKCGLTTLPSARSPARLKGRHVARDQAAAPGQPAGRRRRPVAGARVRGHPSGGAVLVAHGVGGPPHVLDDWRVSIVRSRTRWPDLDMTGRHRAGDHTHLHFDHCGQNAVFKHAPAYVQRAELAARSARSPSSTKWFGFMNARFELLDGDAEVLPGLEVVATPGHTEGHRAWSCAAARRVRPAESATRPTHRGSMPPGERQAPGRPGQRRPGVARLGAPDKVPWPGPGAFLPSHGHRSQLTETAMRVIAEAGTYTAGYTGWGAPAAPRCRAWPARPRARCPDRPP